jgi:hypothetical protein
MESLRSYLPDPGVSMSDERRSGSWGMVGGGNEVLVTFVHGRISSGNYRALLRTQCSRRSIVPCCYSDM